MNYQDLDKVFEIDTHKMYEEVLASGIPFFQWSKWLEQFISRKYLERVYLARQQLKSQQAQNNPNTKKDVITCHYIRPFSVIQDYFYVKSAADPREAKTADVKAKL